MSKVKIFSIYYSKQNLFHGKAIKTDIIEPIQTGKAATGWDLGMLSDDTGDNISSKNPYYGELTCWYWVWKNWLPQHPECEYIGFTQYRRMLQLSEDRKRSVAGGYLKSVYKHTFKKICNSYTEDKVLQLMYKYDCIIPYQWHAFYASPYKRFSILENRTIYNVIRKILIGDATGEYGKNFDKCMKQNEGHYKPAFIMNIKVFNEFMEWVFNICSKITEELMNMRIAMYPRIYAYCIEYFMNYWIYTKQYNSDVMIQKTFLYEARYYKKMFKDHINYKRKTKKIEKNLLKELMDV